MNIAIFTNNYLPNPYGVSMSIESFRKEFEKAGHTVYIFAPEFKGHIDENPNVFRYPSLDLNFRGVRFPIVIPFSRKMDKILEKLEIDVIHSQHPNLLGWAAKKWAKQKKVSLVFTWHTLYDHYAHFTPLIPDKIAAAWAIGNAKRFANVADQVIVPTPTVENILRGWGVTNKNVAAISSGVDQDNFKNAKRDLIRKKYSIAEDEFLILLVSRLTPEKNINFLFDALSPLVKENSKLKFLIVGEGNEKKNLEKQVIAEQLQSKIFFTGVIGAKEIKNYYAAADIFVHASKSETQGMILTEAMYMRLPIVAVNASGAKDLVENNVTGFLVSEDTQEFQKKVKDLMENTELRKSFSENAKKIAQENYTSSICTQKMLEVYQQAIKKKD